MPRIVNGKEVWYYWFMENGKQIRKSTRCKKENEAKAFHRQLVKEGEDKDFITLNQFIEEFFIWNKCHWIKKQHAKGKSFSDSVAKSRRDHLDNLNIYLDKSSHFC